MKKIILIIIFPFFLASCSDTIDRDYEYVKVQRELCKSVNGDFSFHEQANFGFFLFSDPENEKKQFITNCRSF